MDKSEPEVGGEFLVEFIRISKAYGATQALKDVAFQLRAGEVHALVGENGAGKSTLVRILSCAVKRDAGALRYCGGPFEPGSPVHTLRAGIVVIYQELNLAGHLNAAENIFLGQEKTSFDMLSTRWAMDKTRAILSQLGADFDPGLPVRRLSVAQRQLVEIARALALKAKVVVMDEPSATLSPAELRHLFKVIQELKARGGVIGGGSLMGGEGTIMGSVIGVFIIAFLRNGCNIMGVSKNWEYVVIGTTIAIAVISDRFRHIGQKTQPVKCFRIGGLS